MLLAPRPLWIASLNSRMVSICCSIRACSQRNDQDSDRNVAFKGSVSCSER
ncbi:hypothetical protein D3C84_484660 [compost metagenome]